VHMLLVGEFPSSRRSQRRLTPTGTCCPTTHTRFATSPCVQTSSFHSTSHPATALPPRCACRTAHAFTTLPRTTTSQAGGRFFYFACLRTSSFSHSGPPPSILHDAVAVLCRVCAARYVTPAITTYSPHPHLYHTSIWTRFSSLLRLLSRLPRAASQLTCGLIPNAAGCARCDKRRRRTAISSGLTFQAGARGFVPFPTRLPPARAANAPTGHGALTHHASHCRTRRTTPATPTAHYAFVWVSAALWTYDRLKTWFHVQPVCALHTLACCLPSRQPSHYSFTYILAFHSTLRWFTLARAPVTR